ncbi:MAG: zinc ribbon domain-containing protein [Anaerolineae bacterium]|nr:zinc ribbon domain-containing protein [Anaerolineae bacterium]NUQ03427.1 zinc ribbon domain-containing protein [Anaerolineae bacterium]
MPLYDYRCASGHAFEARHGMNAAAPACPVCGAAQVQRVITAAPCRLLGMAADAGRSGSASMEQINSKWAEETPKLREKLVSKLGEETVSRNLPTLTPKEG